VLNTRHSTILVVMLVVSVAGGRACHGQEAEADRAKALLNQGIAHFNALKFRQAKAALLKVDREALDEADKKNLDEYLGAKVDPAIRQQMAARASYRDAEKAMAAGDLAKAKAGFAAAAASEYLPAATRQDASAQLAVVEQKIAVAAAAKAAKPAKAKEPAAEPTTRPAEPQPAAEQSTPTDDQAERRKMFAEMKARSDKARQLVAMGQQALDQGQPERAAGYFQRALALDPGNAVAKRQLGRAQGMTATSGDAGILGRLETSRRIARQAADVEFERAMTRSQELLGTADRGADFDRSEDAARLARNILETNKSLYSEREYRERLIRADDQVKHVQVKREQWSVDRARKQAEEIAKREQERIVKEREERRRKIVSLTERARALRDQRKYTQALEVARQVLNYDPNDPWATEQVGVLEQFILLQEEKDAHRVQRFEEKRQLIDVRRAEIPWWQLIKYPRDWKELTIRREPFGAHRGREKEEDRLVRQQLARKMASVEFDETAFEDAIKWLQDFSGLNIHVKWDALLMLGIDRTKEVTVHLKDVTVDKALRTVLDDVGGTVELSYLVDDGVVTISTKDDLSTRTYPRVYDIRDLIVRVPNFYTSGLSLEAGTGQNAGGNAGGFGDDDDDDDDEEENTPTKQELVDNIVTLVQETIDPESWPPAGNVGSIRELHGQLVVTQTPDNHKKLIDLISQLREARALQIAIEARFISVNSSFLNSIGIDLDFYFNLGSRLGSTTVTDPFTGATVPTTSGTSGWGAGKPGDNKWTPLALTQNTSTFTNMLGVSTAVGGGIGGQITNPALSLGGTFLDDIQVDFLIQATQAHSATRSLTAPRLTLYNGQRAFVEVATTQAYVSDLEPIVAENTLAFNPVIDYVGSGASLMVEATISADRRYVTLTVWPEVVAVNSFDTYAVIRTAVDANGNPITGEGFIQLPNVTVQRVQTTVSVPDGGTLLLGGQRLSGEVEREMGVPLLNKIPIINRAFANRGTIRDEQTLLILIKPKIIIQREEEERQYPD